MQCALLFFVSVERRADAAQIVGDISRVHSQCRACVIREQYLTTPDFLGYLETQRGNRMQRLQILSDLLADATRPKCVGATVCSLYCAPH